MEAPVVSDLSVSRIKLADKCALAYRYNYLDQLPAPTEAAAKIFGTVVHVGVERWYGPEGSTNHTTAALERYVDEVWWEVLPRDVAIALRHAIVAQTWLDDLAQLIQISRPDIKAPSQTKDYLTSKQFKQFEDARDALLSACTQCETMRWPKDENPLQAYIKSMKIAQQLQVRWQNKPRPLVVEQEFSIPFAGVNIRGRIDQIRADPDPMGQVHVEGVDLKTGRQKMTQMDAFIQAFLYDEACRYMDWLPQPEYWTFWMARLNMPQHGRIDRERHARLAESIVRSVTARIESGDYTPHYGMWCKSCDFADLCEREISLWPVGEDSLTLELAPV